MALSENKRIRRNKAVNAIHARRRKKKRCIDNGTHGKAYKGGRCKPCWKKKLSNERKAYAKRKASR